MGISHSHFLGGPRRWTEADQDKAVEYESLLKLTCSCGTRADQWADDPHAFVGYNWRCSGCEILEQERSNVPDGEKGVHVGLIPRALSEKMEGNR